MDPLNVQVLLSVDVALNLGSYHQHSLRSTQPLTMSVELETKVDEVLGNSDHLGSVDVSTNQEPRVWSGQLESVDTEQSSPVRLVNVLSKRSDLSGGSHLNTPVISTNLRLNRQKLTRMGRHLEDGSRRTEEP